MRTKLLVISALLALVAVACSDNRVAPTTAGGGGNGGDGDGGGSALTVAEGQSLYEANCIACHAAGGVGIDGLGKALVDSEFIKGIDDTGLVALIIAGRDTSDPANTSGVAMPVRGGNPALTDDQIGSIVQYLRSLN